MEPFTVTWRLDNFSFFWQTEIPGKIYSSIFYATCVGKSSWRLLITDEIPGQFVCGKKPRNVNFFNVGLERANDRLPLVIGLFTEVELLLIDGSLLCPRKYGIENVFNERCNVFVLTETLSFDRTIAEILPEDVLIVKCKMWRAAKSFMEKGECFIRTSAIVENMEVVAEADGISTLKPNEKVAARVTSVSPEKVSFTVNIFQSEFGRLFVNIIGKNLAQLGFCRVLILDNVGKWEVFGQDSEWEKHRTACEFVLSRSFDYLLNNKEQYLQNDMITMKCIVVYCNTNEAPKRDDEIEYGFNYEEKKESHILPPTLSDDLYSFHKEGVLCDVKVRAESETFMAHKIVLSARSLVFKKMFTSDMSENKNSFVNVPNISDNILRSFLMFLYTDRTGALDWQTAVDLYFVACMYEIEGLKRICSNFLKNNVEPSRCCDLLLMSDLHQDFELKLFVHEYIMSREKEVYTSPEWKTFQDEHPRLVADAMIFKYLKYT